jgi:hypothetical protein
MRELGACGGCCRDCLRVGRRRLGQRYLYALASTSTGKASGSYGSPVSNGGEAREEVGYAARLARAGFSGLSRLCYRTELLHHAEHVYLDPALHDLALYHPVDGMTYELDPLAGRGYSLELAQVRA